MGQIYSVVSDFLATKWAEFENKLSNPAEFQRSVETLVAETGKWRKSVEEMEIADNADIYAKLACRQLDAFVRLCYRDGYAPLLSSLFYTVEGQVYDLLVEKNLGAKRGELQLQRESVLDILSLLAQDFPWIVYLHTLVTLQRLKRAVRRLRDEGGQWGRWGKEVETLIDKGLTNIHAVLPFQISIKWLLEGLIPVTFSEREMAEIGRLLRLLWGFLQKEMKLRWSAVVPPSEDEEIGRFFIDFIVGVLSVIQSKLTTKLSLPPIEKPIKVVVAWGDDAKYTQSVAFFRDEGSVLGVYVFKPPGSTFYVPEEIHLLLHEGIPGHAYAIFLQQRMETSVTPVDAAFRLSRLGGLSFIDSVSVFHEGWAVFAQYLGSTLLENETVQDFFWRELVSYLERFLVLQHIVPLYTVKPHIPRFAEPYQFASYFVGFLLWFILYQKEGNVWTPLMRGEYPYLPSTQEVKETLQKLVEIAQQRVTKKKEVA